MKRQSKRFNPSRWSERLVPVLLAVLLLALVATLALIVLSVLGLTPASYAFQFTVVVLNSIPF